MDNGTGSAYVQAAGLRMHCRVRGDGDGPPLLLVHGGFASSRWWAPLIDLLPDDLLTIAPDLRGCGLSDKPDTGYGIASQASDLGALIEALDLDDFDLVAHGAGAAIAIECLLSHPAPARSMTLISGAPVEGVNTPHDAIRLLTQMREDKELLRTGLAALMPLLAASSPAFFELLVEDAAQMAAPAFTEVTASLGSWNRLTEAKQLTLPSLLIWGDADPIVTRDDMTRSLLAIPGAANLEVLSGIGHSPMLDAPLLLAEKIVDFIAEDFTGLAEIRTRGLE